MEKVIDEETLGDRIHNLRTDKNESQADLAHAVGTTQNNISRIEKGGETSSTILIGIAKHYNVSLDYLCNGANRSILLNTLTKYIDLNIGNFTGIENYENIHKIPTLTINEVFFGYINQVALVKNLKIPTEIKELWIDQAKSKFFSQIRENNPTKDFLLVKNSIFSEGSDIINILEKHCYSINDNI